MSLHDIAKQVQSKGRDEDTVLIHMTPGEVNGLQQLAMAHGGSLTINPETGLPEAGFLKKLLPMVIGAGLMMIPGVNAIAAAAMVGGGSTALGLSKGKGLGDSLKQGLMAGLGAYGGASIAGGLGVGAAGTAARTAVGEKAVTEAAKTAATEAAKTGAVAASPTALMPAPYTNEGMGAFIRGTKLAAPVAAAPTAAVANQGVAAFDSVANAAKLAQANVATAAQANAGLSGFGARFGEVAKAPLFAGGKNYLGSYAPMVAGAGAVQGISKAATPSMPKFNTEEEEKSNYAGPYVPTPRTTRFPGVDGVAARDPNDSSEFRYFDTINPTPSYMPSSRLLDQRGVRDFYPTAAAGGEMNMKDGAFVLDARTVSELGNGSSNAGKEALSRVGGVPINGPGDGVSDSIHANIGGTQEARVARDEVMVPPEAVRQMGGAGKLYALMDKAHKARKTADRGEDTGLSRGLMA